MSDDYAMIDFNITRKDDEEMVTISNEILDTMRKRRTVREISSEPIDNKVIQNLVEIFGTGPSGANKQPWFLCVVSDPEMKRKISEKCEEVELENYSKRFSESMKNDLKKLKTNNEKPFLEKAPYLLIIFREKYHLDIDGNKSKNYYTQESTGIATGILLSAITQCGLVTIPYTPSPMGFLNELLDRAENEVPFMVLPVGHPEENAKVPALKKKSISEYVKFY